MKKILTLIILGVILLPADAAFCKGSAGKEASLKNSAKYEAMIPVKTVRRIALPKSYHEGLLFVQDEIWVANGEGGKTWVVDIAAGNITRELVTCGNFTEAIAGRPDGKYWVSDWDAKKLYLARIEGDKMVAESEVDFATAHPAGLVQAGANYYLITWTRGLLGTKFHLLELDANASILRRVRIKKIEEPSQLAWDGKNLWISSWFHRRVYRVAISRFEITGYFRSGIKKTTGIAWDGKYFWVTGTYADLFQMELAQ